MSTEPEKLTDDELLEKLSAASTSTCVVSGKPTLRLDVEGLQLLNKQGALELVLKEFAVSTSIGGYEYLKGLGLG